MACTTLNIDNFEHPERTNVIAKRNILQPPIAKNGFTSTRERKGGVVFYQWYLKTRTKKEKQTTKCSKQVNTALETLFQTQHKPNKLKLVKKVSWNNKNILTGTLLSPGTEMKIKRKTVVLGTTVPLPRTWEPVQSHTCQLFPLSQESQEFQNIKATMTETVPNIEIEEIQRVQNLLAYQRYYIAKTQITRDGVVEANEKLLFHGTRNTNPGAILSSQDGFDCRLASNQNLWGPGAYFAEDLSYVDPYGFRCSTSSKQVIIASVIIGNSFDFGTTTNPTLTKPPMDIYLNRRFDSITGITRNARIYAVFDSAQCCPRYVVKYSTKKPTTWTGTFS